MFNTIRKIISNKLNIALILLAIPPILEVIYIKIYGVNVIHWDDFDFALPYVEKLYEGLTLNDIPSLFAQHNEHRLFFPRIIIMILAYVTHYNTLAEMYVSWIFTIIISILIFKIYRLDLKNFTSLIMITPVVWIIFNFGRLHEIILWGSPGIVANLTILGFIASIYMLEKTEKIDDKFIFAISCGFISSFSFLNGLLIWPIGVIFIILTKTKNRQIMLIVWAIISTLVLYIYFYDWVRPAHHPPMAFDIIYLFANIGSPMAFSELKHAAGTGILFTILTLIISTIIFKNKIMKDNAIWLTFIIFSVTSSIIITIGRSGFGPGQALVPRYAAFTSLGFIGLYIIISNLYKNNNQKYAILYGMILSVIMIGIIIGYSNSIDIGKKISAQKEINAYSLTKYKWATDEELKKLYSRSDIVRKRAEILQKYNLNVFYSSIQDWSLYRYVDGGIMRIDYIYNISYHREIAPININKNKSVSFNGWAVDDNTKDGTVKSYLHFSNIYGEDIIIPTRKVRRLDVANHFGIKSYELSGWSTTISPKNFKNMCYNISVRILKTNSKEYFDIAGERQLCFD